MQSLFFETRSRAERLKNMREEQSDKVYKFFDKNYNLYPAIKPNSLAFHCTIIPTDELALQEFVTEILKTGFRRPSDNLFLNRRSRFSFYSADSGWQSLVRGAVITKNMTAQGFIDE